MTIGIEGGTSGPMMQEAQVRAPAYAQRPRRVEALKGDGAPALVAGTPAAG